MTVSELIDHLAKLPPDLIVCRDDVDYDAVRVTQVSVILEKGELDIATEACPYVEIA
jgi:hypothetical protein